MRIDKINFKDKILVNLILIWVYLDKKLKMNAILKIKSTSSKGNKHFPKAKKWSYSEELQ